MSNPIDIMVLIALQSNKVRIDKNIINPQIGKDIDAIL